MAVSPRHSIGFIEEDKTKYKPRPILDIKSCRKCKYLFTFMPHEKCEELCKLCRKKK